MKYPDENRMLVIRPCIKAICLNIKPASHLLSHLLYLARNCDEQQTDFSFSSTQEELLTGLIDEMDVKTLHRTAIPMLRLFGFLDVDGSSYRYTYTIHLDLIQQCLLLYKDKQQLDKILIVAMREQLEKCLIQIDKCPIELVKCPIELDKILIPFRQMSNSKRGRKPKPQATLEVISEEDRILEINKITERDKENGESSSNIGATAPFPSLSSSHQEIDLNHSSTQDVDNPPVPSTSDKDVSLHIASTTSTPPPDAPSQEKVTQVQDKPTRKTALKEVAPPDDLSPAALLVIERWAQARKKLSPLTQQLKDAAKLLEPVNPSVEQLNLCRGYCLASNPKWFKEVKRGAVTLMDVAKNWEAWESSLQPSEEPRATQPTLMNGSNGHTSTSANAHLTMLPPRPPTSSDDLRREALRR